MFPFFPLADTDWAPEVSHMIYVRGIKGYYWNFGVGGCMWRSENNLKGISWAGLTWRVRSNQSILKEISPEYSLEGLMLRLKLPILWPPDGKSQLTGKRHWCWERLKAGGEGATEDEMVGWHHWLNGHESEQTPGDSERQGSLVYWGPWCCRESDTTEWLNKLPGVLGRQPAEEGVAPKGWVRSQKPGTACVLQNPWELGVAFLWKMRERA